MTEKRQPVDLNTKVLILAIPGALAGAGIFSLSVREAGQHFEAKRELANDYEDTNPMPYADTQYSDATSLIAETNRTFDALLQGTRGEIVEIPQVVDYPNVQRAEQIMREQQEYYTARTEHVSASLEEGPLGIDNGVLFTERIVTGLSIAIVSVGAGMIAGMNKRYNKRRNQFGGSTIRNGL